MLSSIGNRKNKFRTLGDRHVLNMSMGNKYEPKNTMGHSPSGVGISANHVLPAGHSQFQPLGLNHIKHLKISKSYLEKK
jgi:hypothetical protein